MKQALLALALPVLIFSGNASFAQFAPAAGTPGTTAMFKDSSAFTAWAVKCRITRGLQDISVSSGPYANVGDSTSACGPAGANGVVSLGDGGIAVLQFLKPLQDVPGPDLAVFENSFDDTFLELAFVEVSSNGSDWFRFPAVSQTDTATQTGSFGLTDPTKIHNLAGKYRANYGTPFDLSDIPNNPLLDKQAITHVRVIDVVGSIQPSYCTRDKNQRKINDPWPTAFGSGGFDLDAVGLIRQPHTATSEEERVVLDASVFPNPASNQVSVRVNNEEPLILSLLNTLGETVIAPTSDRTLLLNDLPDGIYTLCMKAGEKQAVQKILKLSR